MKDNEKTKERLIEEMLVLQKQIEGLKVLESEHKRTQEALIKIARCFWSFGPNTYENINKLVESAGVVLEGSAAFYNRVEKSLLCTVKGWCIPADFARRDNREGRLCYDVITRQKEEPLIIHNLENTSYANTDPNVRKYKLKSYIGCAVKLYRQTVGALCVVYRENKSFSPNEVKILSILARAIGAEEERQDREEELARTCELLKKNQEKLIQSEKMAALGRFSSGVTHQIKNPLGVILSGVEFLERRLTRAHKQVRQAITKIKESAFRADTIIHSLLTFARPSEIKTKKLNPKDLIEDVLALVKYRVPLGDIEIKVEFAESEICIDVDKNQIQQVLFNILINAVESMPGGGLIQIRVYAEAISDSMSDKSDCIIEINDTGEGIPKDNLSRVPEPFFTTKRDKKGTGLGLAVAKMIIEKHKGELSLESDLDRGTKVKVILPIAK
jgi:signal transduction histidine kinase